MSAASTPAKRSSDASSSLNTSSSSSSSSSASSSSELSAKKAKSALEASQAAAADSAAFIAPSDWPAASSDIDLKVQDLPHASADTEWWYINAHVHSNEGRQFSLFASFFRVVKDASDTVPAKALSHAHSLTWAIVDVDTKQYYFDPFLDPDTPSMLRKQLLQGKYDIDKRMQKAFLEVLAKDAVPLPDRLMPRSSTSVATDRLSLKYSNCTFDKDDATGQYLCHCENLDGSIAFSLTLTPSKPPQRQGHEGVVKVGLKQDTMFYYFIPRNEVVGTVKLPPSIEPFIEYQPAAAAIPLRNSIPSTTFNVTGNGWYDHEFGGTIKPSSDSTSTTSSSSSSSSSTSQTNGSTHASSDAMSVEPKKSDSSTGSSEGGQKTEKVANYAWNWLSAQLDDGTDITATMLWDPVTQEIHDNFALIIGPPTGKTSTGAPAPVSRVEYLDMTLKSEKDWVSVRTTNDYPTIWRLSIPSAQCELTITAVFPNQEFITLISKPAFWEGRVHLQGTLNGKPINGYGFVERHGFTSVSSLDRFFKRISKEVFKQVEAVIPRNATAEQLIDLVSTDEFPHFLDSVNLDVYRERIIGPIREIIDRGGKSWRSFATLLCVDAVGGNSDELRAWLAMPELMHVGSLIIDDIQDKSPTRRGGPSAHLIYGEPIAINAGTAAYFLTLHALMKKSPNFGPSLRLRLYEVYVLCMRAGHAGQALDIHGQDYMMEQAVVDSSKADLLVQRVIATHRLKSAVPAGLLARMGATMGRGATKQINALGMYFESIGIAFQIVDDILNLRGFDSGGGVWKDRGEDIKAGKVTFPIALAMSSPKLSSEDKKWIWQQLQSKPQEQSVVDAVIDKVNIANALNESHTWAEKMVDDAWAHLDSQVPDSFYKLLLRAFGFYVLQRHY